MKRNSQSSDAPSSRCTTGGAARLARHRAAPNPPTRKCSHVRKTPRRQESQSPAGCTSCLRSSARCRAGGLHSGFARPSSHPRPRNAERLPSGAHARDHRSCSATCSPGGRPTSVPQIRSIFEFTFWSRLINFLDRLLINFCTHPKTCARAVNCSYQKDSSTVLAVDL